MDGLAEDVRRAGRQRLVQPARPAGARCWTRCGSGWPGRAGRSGPGTGPGTSGRPGSRRSCCTGRGRISCRSASGCCASRPRPVPAACPGRQRPRSAAGSSRFPAGCGSRLAPCSAVRLGHGHASLPDCWPSSPGQTPVSLRVPSAAPRSTAALTTAKIAPCSAAASRTSRQPRRGVGGLGRVVFPPDDLPDPLEDGAGEHPAQHADQHAHRLVQQLDHRLLHHLISQKAGDEHADSHRRAARGAAWRSRLPSRRPAGPVRAWPATPTRAAATSLTLGRGAQRTTALWPAAAALLVS